MKKIFVFMFVVFALILSCEKTDLNPDGTTMPATITPDIIEAKLWTYICPSCSFQRICACGEAQCWNNPATCDRCACPIPKESMWRGPCAE